MINSRISLFSLLALVALVPLSRGMEGNTKNTPPSHHDFTPAELKNEAENLLITHYDSSSISSILDVGCGTGKFAYDLALKYPDAHITAIDKSLECIQSAQKNYQAANLTFKCHDLFELSEDTTFDQIYCISVIHWIENKDQYSFCTKLQKLLKPQGTLLGLTLGNNEESHKLVAAIGTILDADREWFDLLNFEGSIPKSLKKYELVKIFEEAGFNNLAIIMKQLTLKFSTPYDLEQWLCSWFNVYCLTCTLSPEKRELFVRHLVKAYIQENQSTDYAYCVNSFVCKRH